MRLLPLGVALPSDRVTRLVRALHGTSEADASSPELPRWTPLTIPSATAVTNRPTEEHLENHKGQLTDDVDCEKKPKQTHCIKNKEMKSGG